MKITIPDFYNKFKCKASSCSDSCCVGWEIDIDSEAYKDYISTDGAFGERLKSSITHGEQPSFLLCGERCPFLNKDNLCDIILELGEDRLCEICTEHPRFHEWFDGLTETGLGLCCEEVCTLLFEKNEALSFVTYESDGENCFEPYNKQLFEALHVSRETAYAIAWNRDFTINERMAVLTAFIGSLQGLIDNEEYSAISALCINLKNSGVHRDWLDTHGAADNGEDFIKSLIALCGKLEPIDTGWTVFCEEANDKLSAVFENEHEFIKEFKPLEYTSEHLLVYFIYRYFMKAVFDEEIISRVMLGIVCVTLVGLQERLLFLDNGEITKADVERAAKFISKEIEYSEDNLEKLADECYGGVLSAERVTAFLLGKR